MSEFKGEKIKLYLNIHKIDLKLNHTNEIFLRWKNPINNKIKETIPTKYENNCITINQILTINTFLLRNKEEYLKNNVLIKVILKSNNKEKSIGLVLLDIQNMILNNINYKNNKLKILKCSKNIYLDISSQFEKENISNNEELNEIWTYYYKNKNDESILTIQTNYENKNNILNHNGNKNRLNTPKKSKNISDENVSYNNSVIENLKIKNNELNEQIISLKNKINFWESEVSNISEMKKEIKTKDLKINSLIKDNSLNNFSDKFESLEILNKKLKEEISLKDKKLENLEREKRNIIKENETDKLILSEEIDSLKRKISTLEKSTYQDDNFTENLILKKEINDLKSNLSENKINIPNNNEKDEIIIGLKSQIEELNKINTKLEIEKENLNRKINKIEKDELKSDLRRKNKSTLNFNKSFTKKKTFLSSKTNISIDSNMKIKNLKNEILNLKVKIKSYELEKLELTKKLNKEKNNDIFDKLQEDVIKYK